MTVLILIHEFFCTHGAGYRVDLPILEIDVLQFLYVFMCNFFDNFSSPFPLFSLSQIFFSQMSDFLK